MNDFPLMIDFVTSALTLADTEPGAISVFLAQVWLWSKVALGIGLVIFVHELGHFLAAKTFGVKCEKFYVGFDPPIKIGPIKFPRTLGKFTYGETEYGIGIIPLGGYVKMLGQDDDPRKAEQEAERIRLGGGEEDMPEQLDPRSYPAKPVWQRMIIISAGVVVNVITGIMFAAIAFFSGVEYTPAIVGSTISGGPAWQAGITDGSQVTAVADLEEDENMHFNEMVQNVLYQGLDDANAKTTITVLPASGGNSQQYQLSSIADPRMKERRMIGLSSASLPQVIVVESQLRPNVASTAIEKGLDGADIIGLGEVDIDPTSFTDSGLVRHALYSRVADDIKLKLRPAVDEDDEDAAPAKASTVTLPPQPAFDLGVRFQIGPIAALVSGGPAEAAGLQIGDQIVAINDQREIDALSLISGDIDVSNALTLTFNRDVDGVSTEQTLSIDPGGALQTGSPIAEIGNVVGLTPFGFAYELSNVVSSVHGAASKSELSAGDSVSEFTIVWPEDALPETLSSAAKTELTKPWELGNDRPLASFMQWTQALPDGVQVKVKAIQPSKQVVEATLPIAASGRFWHNRGLELMPLTRIQTASSLGEACSLGVREGKRRMTDVVGFLGLLVQGKVKAKFVGGPVQIARMAAHQTKKGTSKQLLFLTMLSMNLAILNFLPIPALDGGHMVFLTAELIRGKKVDEQLEMKLTAAGVLMLLALMVFVFANDIINIAS